MGHAAPVTVSDAFRLRPSGDRVSSADREFHVIRKGIICGTDARGYATPRGRSLAEIVLDASEGFIPLWARDVTLRWRFQERSLSGLADPAAAKAAIEGLLAEALLAWGSAAPVRFAHRTDAWDFEIVMREGDRCNAAGCVLASAFFPDAGRHELVLYPRMFTQSRAEQVETLVHEIGHIFGLRHFFAQVSESAWPSVVFGTHKPFTIMNYGAESVLSDADRSDLARLYRSAWNGTLTAINGTRIRLVKPFHRSGGRVAAAVAAAAVMHVSES